MKIETALRKATAKSSIIDIKQGSTIHCAAKHRKGSAPLGPMPRRQAQIEINKIRAEDALVELGFSWEEAQKSAQYAQSQGKSKVTELITVALNHMSLSHV